MVTADIGESSAGDRQANQRAKAKAWEEILFHKLRRLYQVKPENARLVSQFGAGTDH
jgi:hypothetical protein